MSSALAVLTLVAATLVCAVPAFAAKSSSSSADETGDTYSFYKSAAAAAVYVDNMIAANKDISADAVSTVGQAAGMVGYPDRDVLDTTAKSGGWSIFIPSAVSKNAYTYSYDAYNTANLNIGKLIVNYGRFGYMLNQLGLDSTGDSGVTDMNRTIIGNVLYLSWQLANAADSIIQWSFEWLAKLNPFALVSQALYGSSESFGNPSVSDTFASGAAASVSSDANKNSVGAMAGASAAWSKLTGFFKSTYGLLYKLSWVVIFPVLVISALVLWLLGRAFMRSRGSSLAKHALYLVLMLGLGIPAFGLSYTAAVNQLAESASTLTTSDTQTSVSPANRAILSTIVDTASWAQDGFNVGDGMTLKFSDANTGAISADTITGLRSTVLAINGVSLGDSQTNSVLSLDTTSGDKAYTDKAESLIKSYISGSTYEAASYETTEKGKLAGSAAVAEWLQATSNPETFAEGLAKLRGQSSSSDVEVTDAGIFNGQAPQRTNSATTSDALSELYDKLKKAEAAGDDEALVEQIKQLIEKEKEADSAAKADGDSNTIDGITWFEPAGSGLALGGDGAYKGRLSVIGTYNYLNTKFEQNGFTVYSSTKSANTQSRVSHYSASLAGGAVLGPLMAANAVALMLAFAITALVYGLMMLLSNVKRGFTLIAETPFALLGSMRGIARVCCIVLMMFAEILATMLLYVVMRNALYLINDVINNNLIGAATSIASTLGFNGTTNGAAITVISLILSTAVLLAYILMAIRVRRSLVDGFSEAASDLIYRVLGVGNVTSSGSNALGALGTGMVRGVTSLSGSGGVAGAAVAAGGAGMAASVIGNKLSHGGDTINGDMITDANADQSEVNQNASDETTNEGSSDSTTTNSHAASATSLTGSAIEGAARQSGASTVSGQLVGEATTPGVDASTTDATRAAFIADGSASSLPASDAYSSQTASAQTQSGDAFASNTSQASLADSVYAADSNASSVFATGDVLADTQAAANVSAADVNADISGALGADAYGTSNADAYGTSNADAYGTSNADAYGTSNADAYGASNADAYGTANADAYGAINADAYGAINADGTFAQAGRAYASADSVHDVSGAVMSGDQAVFGAAGQTSTPAVNAMFADRQSTPLSKVAVDDHTVAESGRDGDTVMGDAGESAYANGEFYGVSGAQDTNRSVMGLAGASTVDAHGSFDGAVSADGMVASGDSYTSLSDSVTSDTSSYTGSYTGEQSSESYSSRSDSRSANTAERGVVGLSEAAPSSMFAEAGGAQSSSVHSTSRSSEVRGVSGIARDSVSAERGVSSASVASSVTSDQISSRTGTVSGIDSTRSQRMSTSASQRMSTSAIDGTSMASASSAQRTSTYDSMNVSTAPVSRAQARAQARMGTMRAGAPGIENAHRHRDISVSVDAPDSFDDHSSAARPVSTASSVNRSHHRRV